MTNTYNDKNNVEPQVDELQPQVDEFCEKTDIARSTLFNLSVLLLAAKLFFTSLAKPTQFIASVLNEVPWLSKSFGLVGGIFNFFTLGADASDNGKNKFLSGISTTIGGVLSVLAMIVTGKLLAFSGIIVNFAESISDLYLGIIDRVSTVTDRKVAIQTIQVLTRMKRIAKAKALSGEDFYANRAIYQALKPKIKALKENVETTNSHFYAKCEKAFTSTVSFAGAILAAITAKVTLGVAFLVGSAFYCIADKYGYNPIKWLGRQVDSLSARIFKSDSLSARMFKSKKKGVKEDNEYELQNLNNIKVKHIIIKSNSDVTIDQSQATVNEPKLETTPKPLPTCQSSPSIINKEKSGLLNQLGLFAEPTTLSKEYPEPKLREPLSRNMQELFLR